MNILSLTDEELRVTNGCVERSVNPGVDSLIHVHNHVNYNGYTEEQLVIMLE